MNSFLPAIRNNLVPALRNAALSPAFSAGGQRALFPAAYSVLLRGYHLRNTRNLLPRDSASTIMNNTADPLCGEYGTTQPPHPHNLHLPRHSFTQDYLSDPSTWPLFVIVLGTFGWAGFMAEDSLEAFKDVHKKWEEAELLPLDLKDKEDRHDRFLQHFVETHRRIDPEGLGIDHEEWATKKTKYLEI